MHGRGSVPNERPDSRRGIVVNRGRNRTTHNSPKTDSGVHRHAEGVRYFNTAGPCVPELHYTVPPEPRLPEARELNLPPVLRRVTRPVVADRGSL